jgi:uncharacterized membrane protein YedE/YeeE
MHDLTPWSALVGGALIGLAASLLLLGSGRVAGVSGMVAGVLLGPNAERGWRAWFLGGLVLAGLVLGLLLPGSVSPSPRALGLLALAGVLVGFGTRMGGGCTSGHGVCGISRLSMRSVIATAIFVAAGMLTASLLHLARGGS